jgi:myosin protein heavy chain
LRQAKEKLEERSNALFDKELKATRLDQNRAVQQLSLEKQELQASLDGANDKVNLVKQKQARSEAYAAECLQELNKVRKVNTDVDRRNVSTISHPSRISFSRFTLP